MDIFPNAMQLSPILDKNQYIIYKLFDPKLQYHKQGSIQVKIGAVLLPFQKIIITKIGSFTKL